MVNDQDIDISWPLNKEKDFGEYDTNLNIVVTRKNPIIAEEFRSIVQQYKVQFVTGKNTELQTENVNNGQIDFEHLRNVLNTIFDNVLHSYGSIENLLCQINIKISSLKKKFLKSGLFRADDEKARGMCDYLINELAVVANSDENLTVNGRFYVDIIITDIANITGANCYNFEQNQSRHYSRPKYISNACKRIVKETSVLLKVKKEMNNLQFLHLLKYGICDLSLIDKSNSDKNCIPLTIAFSLLWQKTGFNMKEALTIFVNKFKMNGHILCQEHLKSKNNTQIKERKEEENESFFKIIENYCKLLRRNIVVMCKKKTII